jgi:tetratricopeptide (TPR) repeat protein
VDINLIKTVLSFKFLKPLFTIKVLKLEFIVRKSKVVFLIIVAGIFVLGVALMGLLVCYRLKVIEEISSEKLSEVYVFFAKNDIKKGIEAIEGLITQFPKTSAAYQARLVRAHILTRLRDYDEALRILTCTENSGIPYSVRPLASIGIIYAYDSKGDYLNAILASKNFINKYPSHFFIRDIYLNLAEYYVLSGLKNDAIRVFRKILNTFPATLESGRVRDRLNQVNQQMQCIS